jgi:hypothetical protein
MEILGLTTVQWATLVGLVVLLLVLLGVLKAVLKLTKTCLVLALIGIAILLVGALVAKFVFSV